MAVVAFGALDEQRPRRIVEYRDRRRLAGRPEDREQLFGPVHRHIRVLAPGRFERVLVGPLGFPSDLLAARELRKDRVRNEEGRKSLLNGFVRRDVVPPFANEVKAVALAIASAVKRTSNGLGSSVTLSARPSLASVTSRVHSSSESKSAIE